MDDKVFDQIIETEKYVNPANEDELDQLVENARTSNDFELQDSKADKIKIKGLSDKNEKK